MSSSLKAALVGTLLLAFGGTCQASLDSVAQSLASGDVQAASVQLKGLSRAERTSIRGRLLEASLLAASGNLNEAEKRYRSLIADAPQQPEPYNNLAVIYAEQGKLDQALELLEKAINTNASYATVRDNLSRIYLEKSLSSYAKALRIEQREKAPKLQALYKTNTTPATAAPIVVASGKVATLETTRKPTPSVVSKPVVTAAPAKPATVKTTPAQPKSTEVTPPVASAPQGSSNRPQAARPSSAVVIQAVKAWAHAWQTQNINAYLAAYSDQFTPSHGLSHAKWKAQRQSRLSRPEHIRVTLEDFAVGFDDATHARVEFIQSYRSDTYHDKTRKQLLLSSHGGVWQILKETTLEVIK